MNEQKHPHKLSVKHQRFADLFLTGIDATSAYRSAGFKVKSKNAAYVNASKLLRTTKVKQYIEAKRQKAEAKFELTRDQLLSRYNAQGGYDIRDFYDAKGNPIPIHLLSDKAAAAVEGFEVEEIYAGQGENRKFIGYTKKYKLAKKRESNDSIARMMGWFNDKVDITSKGEKIAQTFVVPAFGMSVAVPGNGHNGNGNGKH